MAARIAIDDASAYWTFGIRTADGPPTRNGTVKSAALAGGTRTTVAQAQYVPTFLALGASDVFWIDEFERWIMKAPKTGGTPEQVVQCSSFYPGGLEVGGESLYWLDYDSDGPGVFQAPSRGGAATRIAVAQGQLEAIALDETHVYWADYDQSTSTSRVMKVSRGGGEPALLYSTQSLHSPFGDLAAGPSGVYWTGIFGESIDPSGYVNVKLLQIPLGGGAPVTLAEEPRVNHVALDSRDVYWTVMPGNDSPGSVRRLSLRGGTASTVASNQAGVSALAVNEAEVCWLNFAGRIDSGEVLCRAACGNDR